MTSLGTAAGGLRREGEVVWGRRAVAATGRLLGASRTATHTRRWEKGTTVASYSLGTRVERQGPRTTSPCDGRDGIGEVGASGGRSLASEAAKF